MNRTTNIFVFALTILLCVAFSRQALAQSFNRLERLVSTERAAPVPFSSKDTGNTLVYHIRSGLLELGYRLYSAGSGNRAGHNNPNYERAADQGPAPHGEWGILRVPKHFYGSEVWLLSGTESMGRNSILIHPDSIRLHGRPIGESKGCIVVKASQYQQFRADMHRLQPTRIIIDAS